MWCVQATLVAGGVVGWLARLVIAGSHATVNGSLAVSAAGIPHARRDVAVDGADLLNTNAALAETAYWSLRSLSTLTSNDGVAFATVAAVGDAGLCQSLVDAALAIAMPLDIVSAAFSSHTKFEEPTDVIGMAIVNNRCCGL